MPQLSERDFKLGHYQSSGLGEVHGIQVGLTALLAALSLARLVFDFRA